MLCKHRAKPDFSLRDLNQQKENAISCFPQKWNSKSLTSQETATPKASLSLRCGLVYPHLLLWQLSEQRGVKAALKALCEPQVWLEADLVGPQQRCSTSWSAEVMHGFQQFLKAVVVINHIGCEHVVVVVGWVGEVSFECLTPGEGGHLRGVAGAAPCVPQEVEGQIRQDVREVSSRHPSTWSKYKPHRQTWKDNDAFCGWLWWPAFTCYMFDVMALKQFMQGG